MAFIIRSGFQLSGLLNPAKVNLINKTLLSCNTRQFTCNSAIKGNIKTGSFGKPSSIILSRNGLFQLSTNIVRQFCTKSKTQNKKLLQPWWTKFRQSILALKPSIRNKSGSVKNGNNGKKGVNKSDLQRLLALAAKEKWPLAVAICFLFVSSAVTMAVPFSIGRVIDIIYTQMSDGKMVERLKDFCKILLVIFLIGGIANFGRVYLMQTAGNRIIRNIRQNVFSSIVSQDMTFFDKNKTGELINRLSADTTVVGQAVTNNISDGLRSGAQVIAGVSMMLYTSPQLAGLALCIVPPVVLISRVYGRYVQKITKNVQDSLAESTQVAEERLGNMRTVRAFAQEEKEMSQYNDKVNHVLQLSYKEALAKGLFWGSTGMSGNLMMLSILYYGGLMMSEAQITVGELSSFLLYAAFVGVSVGGLSSFYSELMRGLGASARLFELQERIPDIPIKDGLIPNNLLFGEIEFRNVHFSYPTRIEAHILENFNLHVPQGKVLAVVGPSGSGKSTLAALLLRYYDPNQGSVYVDGLDVKQVSPHWLRSNMGLVDQEPALFSCSIAENIAYGALDPSQATMENIIEAAKMANALQFINTFPNGFDTLVGERGVMLSGGQKQRIAIARAILKNPKILVLDEATSALDAESEYLVQEALERVMVGRTVITIAHRLSTIKNAHSIAVLDDGQVVERGTYHELMQLEDGLFKKLVEKQTIRGDVNS